MRSNFQLQNYIKLNDVISGTTAKLNEINPTINLKSKDFEYNKFNQERKYYYSFNTLIATGYNVICFENQTDLITANFDFTGNNNSVLLDFNSRLLYELVKTEKGAKQGTLI